MMIVAGRGEVEDRLMELEKCKREHVQHRNFGEDNDTRRSVNPLLPPLLSCSITAYPNLPSELWSVGDKVKEGGHGVR